MPLIDQILSKELKRRGFIRKGNRKYLLRINDVIVLICFERPGAVLYSWFSLIPVFLPWPGYYYLSYGNRFNNLFSDVDTPTLNAGQESIEKFCKALLQHLDEDILPLLKGLSCAEDLCLFFETIANSHTQDGRSRCFCAAPHSMKRLILYGYLYEKKYNKALNTAKDLHDYVDSEKYHPAMKARIIKECEQIIEWITQEEYGQIEEIIAQNVKDNLGLLEKPTGRKHRTVDT